MKGKIGWASPKPTEFNGKKKIGLKIVGQGSFLDCYEDLDKNIKILKKGNEIEFETEGNTISNIKLIKSAPIKKENSMIKIQGKDHMLYKGLLDKAHKKEEKFSMVITESWVSEDMKMAWCKVRLTAGTQTFDGFGSSTPENTGTMTKTHPVEMAHTRAKGRALRDYVNIGEAMEEELKHDD